MVNKIGIINILLLFILVISPIFSGCQNIDNSTNKTFTFTKGIKFSFEYPSHYQKQSYLAYKSGELKGSVTFFDKLTSDWYWLDQIFIGVEDSNKSAHEAISEIIENKLNKEIIENSNVTMAGMQGEMLVYTYHAQQQVDNSSGLSCSHREITQPSDPNNVFETDRIAYFSDGKRLWSVEIGWSESKAEQQKADFDHILQTFKILP
jgi:hypothetical protein